MHTLLAHPSVVALTALECLAMGACVTTAAAGGLCCPYSLKYTFLVPKRLHDRGNVVADSKAERAIKVNVSTMGRGKAVEWGVCCGLVHT